MTTYCDNFIFKRKNLGKFYIYVAFLICSFPVFGSIGPSGLPCSGFKENKGQLTDQFGRAANHVLFQASLPGLNVWITEEGLKYELFREVPNTGLLSEETVLNHEWCRIDMVLKGAQISKENLITKGLISSEAFDNYFLSHAPDGVFDVLTYQHLIFKDIYPGIDWEILFDENTIKYNFIVNPHADPDLIDIIFNGSGALKNTSKDLIFDTKFGELTDKGLRSYQNQDVSCHYVVTDLTTKINGGYSKKVKISLDAYNTNERLIIDPELVWGTYFGGNGTDRIRSSVIDGSNNLFVTGSTSSTNFPTLDPGGVYYDGTYASNTDLFVSKFNAANQLIWSTYYGSTGQDIGNAIDVNSNGDVYVVGETTNNAFPVLNPGGGAWFPAWGSSTSDAILIRFTNAGVRVWATYLGATTSGSLQSIAIDASNNVFCAGYAQSIGTTNPGGGAYVQAYAGTGTNGTIYKFSSANVLVWRTQYGGSGGSSRIHSIDLDPSGNVFITGYGDAVPSQLDPGGAFMQTAAVANQWSFIAKFSNAGVRLWHTRFGGSTPGTGTGTIGHTVHCDANGNIFLAGITNQTDFLAKGLLVNPGGSAYYDDSHNGGDDFFLMKFDPALSLTWGTYFGSAGTEGFGAAAGNTRERELITDACGNMFFTGRAGSLTSIDPGCNSFFDGTNAGGITESFIARFSSLSELTWSTFLGTSDASIQDCGASMSFDSNGNLFWAGEMSPLAQASYLSNSGGYYSGVSGGLNDGYIMKFTPGQLNLLTTYTGNTACNCEVTASVTSCGRPGYSFSWNTMPVQTTPTLTGMCTGSYTVTVTDQDCKKTSESITIDCSAASVLTATSSSVDDVTCNQCSYSGPSILINEVMLSPTVNDGSLWSPTCGSISTNGCGEWIELYNPNICDPVDVSCYHLGNFITDNPSGSNVGYSGGFTIPSGTIVPANGFLVIRGQNAPAVNPSLLVQNGGKTIEIVTSASNSCIGSGALRLWFPNTAGWFAFYDNNGVPQDAISWGTPNTDFAGNPCVANSGSCPVGSLASYNSIPAGNKNSVFTGAIPSAWGLSVRRATDGGAWVSNAGATPTQGTCNGTCNSSAVVCSGQAIITPTSGTAPYQYIWNDPASQTTSTASNLCEGSYTVTVIDNTGRSDQFVVSVADNCTPLPVELISFNGQCVNRRTQLEWSTASEINSDYFRIEVSDNGYAYTAVGVIEAAGNSTLLRNYEWMGDIPLMPVAYYRLVQVDFNGASKIYGPIAITSDCLSENESYILHNPSSTSIDLIVTSGMSKDVPVTIQVYSADGRLIIQRDAMVHDGANFISIPVQEVASGTYFINILCDNKHESLIFIKP